MRGRSQELLSKRLQAKNAWDMVRRRAKQAGLATPVTNHTFPTVQYEQAGITWYVGGKPVFKLVKELVDGKLVIIPGRKPMTAKSVQLRLIVTADSFTAQYRPNAR